MANKVPHTLRSKASSTNPIYTFPQLPPLRHPISVSSSTLRSTSSFCSGTVWFFLFPPILVYNSCTSWSSVFVPIFYNSGTSGSSFFLPILFHDSRHRDVRAVCPTWPRPPSYQYLVLHWLFSPHCRFPGPASPNPLLGAHT